MSDPQLQNDRFRVLDEILEAWKRADAETVLGHLHDDIEFVYAIGQRPLAGKEIVRRFLSGLAGHQKDVRWRFVHRAHGEDVVIAEGIDDYVNTEGHRIRNPFVSVYEFEGLKIRRWRDYYDQGMLRELEAGKPLSEWAEPLVADDRGRA